MVSERIDKPAIAPAVVVVLDGLMTVPPAASAWQDRVRVGDDQQKANGRAAQHLRGEMIVTMDCSWRQGVWAKPIAW